MISKQANKQAIKCETRLATQQNTSKPGKGNKGKIETAKEAKIKCETQQGIRQKASRT